MSDSTNPREEPLKAPPAPEEPIEPLPPLDQTWNEIKELMHPDRAWARSAVSTQQMADASNAVLLQDQMATMAEVRKKERSNVVKGKDGILRYEDVPEEPVGDIHFGNKIDVHQQKDATPTMPQPAVTPAARPNGTLGKVALGAIAATGLLGAGSLATYALLGVLSVEPIKEAIIEPTPPPARKPANVFIE